VSHVTRPNMAITRIVCGERERLQKH